MFTLGEECRAKPICLPSARTPFPFETRSVRSVNARRAIVPLVNALGVCLAASLQVFANLAGNCSGKDTRD